MACTWSVFADSLMRIGNPDYPQCLLQALLDVSSHASEPVLETDGAKTLTRLTDAGICLRDTWPRPWRRRVDDWLGPRLYLSHASNFSKSTKYTSIVSSRMGRHGQKLPRWPELVNSALHAAGRQHGCLVVVPQTTTANILAEFSNLANLDTLNVQIDKTHDAAMWLRKWLKKLADLSTRPVDAMNEIADSFRRELVLSPPTANQHAVPDVGPIQDRVAIVLSDIVYALSIRPGGHIDRLLTRRLSDVSFPGAQVYVATGADENTPRSKISVRDWLDRGAVGWYVRTKNQTPFPELSCRRSVGSKRIAVGQLCAGIPAVWSEDNQADEWTFLTHCTRGRLGPLPEESESQYRQRAWLEGEQTESHPLVTLSRICTDRKLKGTSRITRTAKRAVSFSAVPLLSLLERRRFRGHLGRWDWEPYGLLIRRAELEKLGARPVIYATEGTYDALDSDHQPFFQPCGRRNQPSNDPWSEEREWRLLGDLDMTRLPPDSISLFVSSEVEAQQMARRFAWPIFWLG